MTKQQQNAVWPINFNFCQNKVTVGIHDYISIQAESMLLALLANMNMVANLSFSIGHFALVELSVGSFQQLTFLLSCGRGGGSPQLLLLSHGSFYTYVFKSEHVYCLLSLSLHMTVFHDI